MIDPAVEAVWCGRCTAAYLVVCVAWILTWQWNLASNQGRCTSTVCIWWVDFLQTERAHAEWAHAFSRISMCWLCRSMVSFHLFVSTSMVRRDRWLRLNVLSVMRLPLLKNLLCWGSWLCEVVRRWGCVVILMRVLHLVIRKLLLSDREIVLHWLEAN